MKRRSVLSRWWLDLPIRHKGLLVVALPLVTLALAIVIRIPNTRQQEETTETLARAAAIGNATGALLTTLLDIETGVRGYALTGDRTFLERYDEARKTALEDLAKLSDLLSSAEDRRLYDEASALVNRELELESELVSHVSAGAQPTDQTIRQQLARGKQTIDAIRPALGAVRHRHDVLVTQSQEELRQLRRRLGPIVLLTWLGGLLGVLPAGWLFATGIGTRMAALEQNADRLARGERLQFASSRGVDEIGSLDKALRRASLLHRMRERELRTVNAELQYNFHEQQLLNRELEAFSYSVSHDLRAPLRSIDGFAQALREDWGERLDEAAQDHLSRVRNAAQRMGRLIDDLLKLSKLTRSQLQRAEVDLSQIARTVCAELTARNPSRDVTWVIADGLRAWCDPTLARVMLENLLGNAWKFTSKTSGARIEFHATTDTRPVLFVIRDNGVGFDMRYVEKLFSPFQRLHGDREFPGTGIGLATVQRIVHKHGGEIRTHAEIGQGATFTFSLGPPGVAMTAA